MYDILVDFTSHGSAYYAGEKRRVTDPEAAAYFVANGWARADGGVAAVSDTSEKTLVVQSLKIGHGATSTG